MASDDMAARELARQLAGVQKSVRSLSRAAQVARSTINVEGADVPIPDVIQTGVDAAGAVDDLRDNVEGSFGDVEDLLGDMADVNRDELDALNATAAAPTGLSIAVNEASWGPSGMVVTTVTLTWNEVVEDIDGQPLIVTGYDIESTVAGDAVIDGQTDLETFTTTLWAPGVERTVRVRARVGVTLGEWSDPITVTPEIPAQVTTPPTPPTLATGGGGVFIAWDGLLTTGPMPAGARGVFAEYRVGTTGTFLRAVGPLSSGAGQVGQVRAAIGDIVQARLRWVDNLGRVSNISDQRQITVKGIELPDLDGEVSEAIAEAQSTAEQAVADALSAQGAADQAAQDAADANAEALAAAGIANSKGKVLTQSATPGVADQNAQTLWIDTTGGANTPKRWNGTTWVAVTDKTATDAASAAASAASAAATADGKAVAAQNAANAAASAASAAQGTANTAVSNAAAAQSAADTAKTVADAAQLEADALFARGTDLITNGDAALGNLNFSTWTVEVGDQPPGTSGAFYAGFSGQGTRTLDEFVPVDPAKSVLPALWVKQVNAGVTSRFYWGMAPYDIDGLAIGVQHYAERPEVRTTLAAPLNPGDTTVQLTSAAGWENGTSAANRYFAVWNYVDGKGKLWPAGSYTRHFSAYGQGAISGNTLTLPAPWPYPAAPAGTPVGNNQAGGSYMYAPGMSNALVPNASGEWTKFVATAPFAGIRPDGPGAATTAWPVATSKAKVIILANYGVSGGTSKQLFAGLSLSEANAAQLRAAEARAAADAAQATATAAQAAAGNAQTTADQAQATASGKSKTYRALTTPSGAGTAVEDTWEQWSSLGTGGKLLAFWRWSGSAWVKGTLDETYLPLVNIGSGTYGALSGSRLTADTVDASKVLMDQGFADKFWANEGNFGKVSTDMVTPNFGEDLQLAANGSIVLALGNAANAMDAAAQADAKAEASGASAGYAAQAAAEAAARAAEAITTTENQGRYYRFGDTDLRIGQPGSSVELSIADTGISFRQNDVPVSLWDGGQMIVKSFVGEEVVLANHKIETRGARTIVRSM